MRNKLVVFNNIRSEIGHKCYHLSIDNSMNLISKKNKDLMINDIRACHKYLLQLWFVVGGLPS